MSIETVPGTPVIHQPAESNIYIGSPSIVRLPEGALVASCSPFGPGSSNNQAIIFRSDDGGRSWDRVAILDNQMWSKLFHHNGGLYLIGTDFRHYAPGHMNGRMVIRRSADLGETWTTPRDGDTGLLTDEDGYHTAPVPVICAKGRIWKAFELAPSRDRETWRPFVISAPADADLLQRSRWLSSEHIKSWPGYQWIEGNVVESPTGEIVNILRSNNLRAEKKRSGGSDTAAIVHVSEDNRSLSHDPEIDRIHLPGGGTKFTINPCPVTGAYLALVNPQNREDIWRNRLCLAGSQDLKAWRVFCELLSHPEKDFHAFQYVDWTFDGQDIVYVSRTAFDDETSGAANAHDANFMTFHRLTDYARFLE